MRVVGVDENGLGPRLGPLIATAVTLEVEDYGAPRLQSIGARLGIDDSKATSGFGRMRQAEGLALAVAEVLCGAVPQWLDALLEALSLDATAALQSPCPDASTAVQCWGVDVLLPSFGGDVAVGRRQLAALRDHGVRLLRARSVVTCAGELNRQLGLGDSKLQIDLGNFERLLIDASRSAAPPPPPSSIAVPSGIAVASSIAVPTLRAYCGMVGGIRRYPKYLRQLATRPIDTVQDGGPLCVYRLASTATEPELQLHFEVGADHRHLPVALASMLGKYLRELLVERQWRFYQQHDASLQRASGYHDPVTARFVERSRPLRRRLAIADDCFERRG